MQSSCYARPRSLVEYTTFAFEIQMRHKVLFSGTYIFYNTYVGLYVCFSIFVYCTVVRGGIYVLISNGEGQPSRYPWKNGRTQTALSHGGGLWPYSLITGHTCPEVGRTIGDKDDDDDN